jgi:hypothetical protein
MKKTGLALALSLVTILFALACSEKPKIRVPMVGLGSQNSPASFHAEGCDESLWSHIYNPGRLQVMDRCVAVTGTVVKVSKEGDGDYAIHMALDKNYETLLNNQNFESQEGNLIVRAICQHKDKEKKQECNGFDKTIEIPAKGARVRVTGSYVLNRTTINAWAEIYPATSITAAP